MPAISSQNQSRFAGANRAALIVVGILSLLGLAYAIMRVDILRARIVDLRTDLAHTREELSAATAQLHALQSTQARDSAQLQQVQDNVNHLSSGLNRQIAQATQQWTRSEVLYLTRLAQDQLLHASDPAGARSSLEAALARSLAQPGVIDADAQQQLHAALETLLALPLDRNSKIDQQLQQLEKKAATLRMAGIAAASEAISVAPASGWQRLWLQLRQAAARVLVIRRSGEQASLLVNEQQETLQRQYLGQQLLTARMALTRRDRHTYEQALAAAINWLDKAFDASRIETQQLRAQLAELQSLSIELVLPDLGPTIAALQSELSKGAAP